MAALAAAIGLAGFVLWEAADLTRHTAIDDDVVLLFIPLGAALGATVAGWTRRMRLVHLSVTVVGLVLGLCGAIAAVVFYRQSEALTGTGAFAGLGEFIIALFLALLATIGVALVLAGLFGRLYRRRDAAAPSNASSPL